jgi:hypothetical protein
MAHAANKKAAEQVGLRHIAALGRLATLTRKLIRVFMSKRPFLASKVDAGLPLSNSVSIIRIIIPRCHEHFNRLTEGPGTARTTAGCTMIRLSPVSGISGYGSIGDTFEREDLLRSVE